MRVRSASGMSFKTHVVAQFATLGSAAFLTAVAAAGAFVVSRTRSVGDPESVAIMTTIIGAVGAAALCAFRSARLAISSLGDDGRWCRDCPVLVYVPLEASVLALIAGLATISIVGTFDPALTMDDKIALARNIAQLGAAVAGIVLLTRNITFMLSEVYRRSARACYALIGLVTALGAVGLPVAAIVRLG